jgi:polysaccharide export outer membrane protein
MNITRTRTRRSSCGMLLFVVAMNVAGAQVTPPRPPGEPVVVPTSRTAAQDAAAAMGKQVSNAEIANLIKSSGLTEAQIRTRLQQAGYDPKMVDPFYSAEPTAPGLASSALVRALGDAGLTQFSSSISSGSGQAGLPEPEAASAASSPGVEERRSPLFGKSVFGGSTTAFEPMLAGAVDPGYRLGAGDVLQAVMTGQVQLAEQLDIRRDGTVLFPSVGLVSVAGLTLEAARGLLKGKASSFFSGLADGKTQLDVTLARLRNVQIFVIGEVERPGSYQVSALSTVFHVLSRAGGPSAQGTFRQIQLRHAGSVVQTIDLYDYLVRGDASHDARIEQGDIVFVPLAGRRISIRGAIRRPGIFELQGREGFRDLLEFAGGLQPTAALQRVQIDRVLPPGQRSPGRDRVVQDVLLSNSTAALDSVGLDEDDVVTVFEIGELRRNSVELTGEVVQAGLYEWNKDLTLAELFRRAEGFLPWALTDRIKVSRNILATGRREVFSLDLADSSSGRFLLEEFDQVTVLDGRRTYPSGTVTIRGAVHSPGRMPYMEHQTLRDLLDLANGLQPYAVRDQVQLTRTDENTGKKSTVTVDLHDGAAPMELRRGDEIDVLDARVSSLSGSVSVQGSVFSPGVKPYARGLTLFSLLSGAGGFREEAQKVEVARRLKSDSYTEANALVFSLSISPRAPFDSAAAAMMLEREDQVFVRASPGFRPVASVIVEGFFQYPGVYAITRDGERLSEIIQRAGGALPTAYSGSLRVSRAGRQIPVRFDRVMSRRTSDDIPVFDGDQIHLDALTSVVTVTGAVERQVSVPFRSEWTVADYINAAGGYTFKADRGNVFVASASGRIERPSRFLFSKSWPAVEPGGSITVGTKETTSDQSFERGLSTTLQVVVTLVTLLIAYKTIHP